MTCDERLRENRKIVDEICAEHKGPFLGAEAVLAQDPNNLPVRSKRTPPPFVHTTSTELEKRYLIARSEFLAAYRRAAEKHAELPTATWPADAFTPPSRFVSVDKTPSLLSMLAR
jgi:hypothetical protein